VPFDAPHDVAPACMPVHMGNACNDLVPFGPLVPIKCAGNAQQPAPTGGTIEDGRYVMVASELYGTCPSPENDRIVWNICNGVWATVQESWVNGVMQTPPQYLNGSVVTTSTSFTFKSSCASAGMTSANFGYDATPGTLTIFVYGFGPGTLRVDHFVRQ
jgi:hypothetical protein